MQTNGVAIRVKGKVQGVGFRPYIWQLAAKYAIQGNVYNDSQGVLIHLYRTVAIEQSIADFIAELPLHCPPLARIDQIICNDHQWDTIPTEFSIISSRQGQTDTLLPPDAATCQDCLNELNDPTNRRYHYPFTNCTHCGPRFTIIERIPYDRPNTVMRAFPLCEKCQSEYNNPADRRFHAQPNACPKCGPQLWLTAANGIPINNADSALQQAAEAIDAGHIVAIKSIGGFHLACDATQFDVVAKLRQRKQRPHKPLAVMLPDSSWLTRCVVANYDLVALNALLTSSAAPIVLAPINTNSPISHNVAPDLNEIGLMLPSNPLHHLLMQYCNKPLVMTSGNAHGKPPAQTNEQALTYLANIADFWLLHDREIIQRADDSIIRVSNTTDQTTEILRRARGFVPDILALPDSFTQPNTSPTILALGADLKNTFCLLKSNQAIVSQHFGDLADITIKQQWQQSLTQWLELYQAKPDYIVVDAHPNYISHRFGKELAEQSNIPVIEVLHHHAHIAACLLEHNYAKTGVPVIGLALDGLGYGANNELWGGECLLVDYKQCTKIGGLPAVALAGGDLAAKQPWRNFLAQMLQFVPDWQHYPESAHIPLSSVAMIKQAITKNINSPLASSTGRLFDAVAAALGIAADKISWEGEAACRLEVLASQYIGDTPPVTMPLTADMTLDLATFWQQWLNWQGTPASKAYAFHYALANGMANLAIAAAKQYNIDTIVLSGGVMQNKLFKKLLITKLHGYKILTPQHYPANDGGISLGQIAVATTKPKQEYI